MIIFDQYMQFYRNEINKESFVNNDIDFLRKEALSSEKIIFTSEFIKNLEKLKDIETLMKLSLKFDLINFPFANIWIEAEKGEALSTWIESERNVMPIYGMHITENIEDESFICKCLCFDFKKRENAFGMVRVSTRKEEFEKKLDLKKGSIYLFLKLIFNETNLKYGIDRVNDRIKVKTRTGNEIHKIKKLIICDLKKTNYNISPISGNKIDWTHSWSVSGHWRRCEHIGKDRSGNYNVNGKTWVIPCVKGQGPLINKTRLYT